MLAPRLSLVTLGVGDMARARRFYEALGLVASGASTPDVTFFQLDGMAFALYGRAELASDANVANSPSGFSGITLAQNVSSEAEVDGLLAHAVACGAALTQAGRRMAWGGYVGYFADPDGHIWEIAFNPAFPLDRDGRLTLP